MRSVAEMKAALNARREGYTLPRAFYVDADIYQRDLESLWYRNWLFAGHDCELRRPGDFFTMQVGDYPILLVRGRDGEIRAFHNSCRHRGSRVCPEAKGSAVRLVCPYHKWSYDLDGRLLFARDFDKSSFNMAELGLKPVACKSVAGYLYVCLAAEPPDFEAFRATVEPYFAPHNLVDAKVAFESTIIEEANWKLVWENNRECYHCSPNHPELCVTFPEAPTISGVDGAGDDPMIAAHWQRMHGLGLPSGFSISADGQYRTTRMPLLPGTVSYTMTGQAAVKRPLSDSVSEPDTGTLLLFNYPSIWNHVLSDHAVTFRVTPIGPLRTAVTTKWLVHRDAVEGVDYDLETLTEVWVATNDQDRRIVEENQRGVCSPAFEPGPYNARHESGVIQFVDWYARAFAAAE